MRIEGINEEKANADVHADLYAELGSSDKRVIRTWQRNVKAISKNCSEVLTLFGKIVLNIILFLLLFCIIMKSCM